MLKNNKYYVLLFILVLNGVIFSQDPPPEFQYNQGVTQSFYFFRDLNIDGAQLNENDWIGAFKTYDETQNGACSQDEMNFDETMNGMCSAIGQCNIGVENCSPEDCSIDLDVNNEGILSSCACPDLNNDDLLASQSLNLCIGSRRYGDCLDLNTRNCDIPVIGYDGNCYTGGYIEPGEYPYFKIYDQDQNETYYTEVSDNYAWHPNEFHIIDSISVVYDCWGDLGGNAVLDDCGVCCGGNSTNQCSYYEDEFSYGGVYDCSGECFGSAELDGCLVCTGGNTGIEPCTEDCNGDLHENPEDQAIWDDCGICSGGLTGIIPNNIYDCLLLEENW